MPNQYTKIPLFLEDDDILDTTIFSEPLSATVIDCLKNILPKDIENINLLIDKIKDEL